MSSERSLDHLSNIIISFIANVDVNDDKAEKLSAQLAGDITTNKIKLLELVIDLKEHLTSEEDSSRKNALYCLSSVLSKIPEDQLKKNEVSVIFAFYLSKLEDKSLFKEALNGFSSLVKMKYITVTDVNTVLAFLMNQYSPSSFLAPVRYFAFKIMDNIYGKFQRKLEEDEEFADNYVKTFLHIVNGEKDPRNLLISFNLNSSISSNLTNVKKFKEDLFDVLFCYFPITFKPPKNDPYKISNTDLKIALRSAISATPEFEEDAFGNLVDKLTASSPTVKNDTLQTLKACVEKFGGAASLRQWLPLWNALKFEIMHGSDSDEAPLPKPTDPDAVETFEISNYQLALDIMRSIAHELVHVDEHAFDKFLTHIFEELKPNFTHEKDLKQSCSVLASIGSAGVVTFNKVIDVSLPLFLQNTSEIPKLQLVIMNLSFFCDAYIKVFNVEDSSVTDKISENSLNLFKDEILIILGKALTGSSKVETTIRTLSVIQFTKMAKMNGYLNEEEIALILQYLTDTILTDNNKAIYHTCLEGLKAIGEIYEDLVYSISLKRMLDLLPLNPSDKISLSDSEPVEKENILKVILDFTTSKHRLIRESLVGLSAKLYSVAMHENSKEYCFLLVSSLYTLLAHNVELIREEDAALLKENIEPQLFSVMKGSPDILADDHNLALLSDVLFFINLKSTKVTHQEELNKYTEYFIDELKVLEEPSRLILPFAKLLCALSKDCQLEASQNIFTKAISLVKSSSSIEEFEKLGYLELIMVLSNKWINEEIVKEVCTWNDTSSLNLEVLVWAEKGLLMKNSPLAVEFHAKFVNLLSDKACGSFVARLFEIFVVDIVSINKYKSIPWCNNTKALYKQKFFCETFRRLVESYRSATQLSLKSNYLTALSLVLKHIPSKIIEPYMDEMLPLLLQALEMPISDVKVSALNTLLDTAEKFHKLISEYAQTLVTTLLKLVIPSKYNNVSVRLISLELLESISKVAPLNYSLPLKHNVISALEPVLDDKKRVVRKQCVLTRQAFFELGQVPFE